MFAAEKHKFQRRKADGTPYINHPIGVALILEEEGDIHDQDILEAALLHDTIEDTDTTLEELIKNFGPKVAGIVSEVTDDKSLAKGKRKREQIRHIPHVSKEAKLVKLADKLYNCRDLLRLTPPDWDVKRVQGYIVWSKRVLRSVRGLNPKLDKAHDKMLAGHFVMNEKKYPAIPEGDLALFLEEYLASMDKLE